MANKIKIPFNKPFLTGKEVHYIYQAVSSGKISGDGIFSKKCQEFFENKYGFLKCLLTTSCTDALELAALLLDIQPGDEVIMPSYTFVSTANAFVLRGANIKFCDSSQINPNIDPEKIKALITDRTVAIVVVHYAGIACDMKKIIDLAKEFNLYVIEDAAQAVDSNFEDKALGSIGDLSAFSFHETKNIQCGEGGMLVVNNPVFLSRAEIIREKGTNRTAFFRGEIDKYGWVDIGSSFLPSEITAAFLFAQLEEMDKIQKRRKQIWEKYYSSLIKLASINTFNIQDIPEYATNNAHMFYIICKSIDERSALINYLKKNGVLSVFHYLSLHKSTFYLPKYKGNNLVQSDGYSETLLRLPLYYELSDEEINKVLKCIHTFYSKFIK